MTKLVILQSRVIPARGLLSEQEARVIRTPTCYLAASADKKKFWCRQAALIAFVSLPLPLIRS